MKSNQPMQSHYRQTSKSCVHRSNIDSYDIESIVLCCIWREALSSQDAKVNDRHLRNIAWLEAWKITCLQRDAFLSQTIPAIAHTISHRLSCNFMHLIYTLAPKSIPLNIRKYNQTVRPTRLLEIQHLAIVQMMHLCKTPRKKKLMLYSHATYSQIHDLTGQSICMVKHTLPTNIHHQKALDSCNAVL